MAEKRYTVLDLFCGCGGLSLGFEKAGYDVLLGIDIWKDALETYKFNHHNSNVLCADISTLTGDDVSTHLGNKNVDVIIGGPPCQGFSVAGKRIVDDERNKLYKGFVHMVAYFKPSAFVMENVPNILSIGDGVVKQSILDDFQELGYHVETKVLLASDYGVPQKRERVIIVGFRDEIDLAKFKYPTKVKTSERKVLGDVIIEESNHDEGLFFSEKAVAGMMAVREKMNKGRAMSLDEPCNTVSAHLAKVSLNSTDPVYMVGERYRRFSTREAARIQSFPDTFKLDSVSQIRQYKAIGNAVPPVMMWHVIQSLKKVFAVHVVDFKEVKAKYPKCIVDNASLKKEESDVIIDNKKHLLVSLVKTDNMEQYLDRSAKVYYTGKKFPSTVALNKLYYFMPYMKRKGVRDLYLINIARVGTKKEVHPECDDNDFRLVFEIQFVKQLFDKYQPIHLDIWQAFTDTTIEKLMLGISK